MKLFFKDLNKKVFYSYHDLIKDLNDASLYNAFCKSDDFYTIFKQIILSILLDREIILLDSDFTSKELINLVGCPEFTEFNQPINEYKFSSISNYNDLIERLRSKPKKWKMTLFTSGTTGIPKKVNHDYMTITRFVKISSQNYKSIWGFAYNPTHMAGVQVFFQAILNGNSIIKLFGLSSKDIFREIKEEKITHISATPTFYRLLLPSSDSFPSVKRITSGGERFSENISKQLSKIFNLAKITNIYASTEAGTLFASKNDIFHIKKENEHLIKIQNNELLIHKSLMGSSKMTIGQWYQSGDMVDVLSENPLKFRFKNRKNDSINVGGYKVNPLEVEDALLELDIVINARVYSKPNSVVGNIICCDIIPSNNKITESSIRESLQIKIQDFKIPRIIKFVKTFPKTRTGKIKRI